MAPFYMFLIDFSCKQKLQVSLLKNPLTNTDFQDERSFIFSKIANWNEKIMEISVQIFKQKAIAYYYLETISKKKHPPIEGCFYYF